MNNWNKFLSKENFVLAWRRVSTGTNVYYKRFFRNVFLAYEVALEENIANLIDRIKGKSYLPREPEKVFLPKASGLQRPVTLLSVEDQIVYQAIANIIADKWHSRRHPFEYQTVFSNIPNKNSIFFFDNYKISYSRFKQKTAECFEAGYKWVAHFDLAAFYDTISHDLIKRMVHNAHSSSELSDLTSQLLKAWTSRLRTGLLSHGVPQGPLASSLIGEITLFDIDKEMSGDQNSLVYLRYVDDIRVMAKEEDAVRLGLVKLEQLCRMKGLIPQSSKTSIFCAGTPEEAIGKSISFTSEEFEPILDKNYLQSCLSEDKSKIENFSRFKYFLYRSNPSAEFVKTMLHLFSTYPDLCDGFQIHLENYRRSKTVINFLVNMLITRRLPYQYYEGVVWLILAKVDPERSSYTKLQDIATDRLLSNSANQLSFNLRFGLYSYLFPYVESLPKKVINRYFYEPSSILQSLIIIESKTYLSSSNYHALMRRCFTRTLPDAGLVAGMKLALDSEKLTDLDQISLKYPVKTLLAKMGVLTAVEVKRAHPFEELMERRYDVKCGYWSELIGTEYNHAHNLLVFSESSYNSNPSAWLCNIDNLNEIITHSIIRNDPSLTVKVRSNNGEIIDFGVFLAPTHPFAKKYTKIADAFRQLHKRRCSTPGAHAYEKKTAKRAKPVKPGERQNFLSKLKNAYSEVAVFISVQAVSKKAVQPIPIILEV